MLKLVRMVQKLKNDKNRDDSLLFSWAHVEWAPLFIPSTSSYSRSSWFTSSSASRHRSHYLRFHSQSFTL